MTRLPSPIDDFQRSLAPQGATPRPDVGSATGWPLVLYFHHVRPDIDHYTVVTPDEFEFALECLSERFRPHDPRLLSREQQPEPCEPPSCLITFDDGYLDVFEHAVDPVEQRGWRAIFFISSNLVGSVERHPVRGALDHMTWSQLREVQARGHVIGCHGANHLDMSLLSADEVVAEIADAQAAIGVELSHSSNLLAYPYGNAPQVPREVAEHLPAYCFGSVKAFPAPWSRPFHPIRRTYLPAGETSRWPELIEGWWRQCTHR